MVSDYSEVGLEVSKRNRGMGFIPTLRESGATIDTHQHYMNTSPYNRVWFYQQSSRSELEGDFRTTTNGRAGGLLAKTGLLSGHPSKQQPRST
ncbi:hypothetical protein J6590_046925 [Homalodisca vitripennis]|nr:hypothetical protein J6590_046925 [Homalodisca vitripennis]